MPEKTEAGTLVSSFRGSIIVVAPAVVIFALAYLLYITIWSAGGFHSEAIVLLVAIWFLLVPTIAHLIHCEDVEIDPENKIVVTRSGWLGPKTRASTDETMLILRDRAGFGANGQGLILLCSCILNPFPFLLRVLVYPNAPSKFALLRKGASEYMVMMTSHGEEAMRSAASVELEHFVDEPPPLEAFVAVESFEVRVNHLADRLGIEVQYAEPLLCIIP